MLACIPATSHQRRSECGEPFFWQSDWLSSAPRPGARARPGSATTILVDAGTKAPAGGTGDRDWTDRDRGERFGRSMREDDDRDRPGRGARFFLRSGDTQLRVVCGDGESTRACVDAALSMFDRVQSQARTTPGSPPRLPRRHAAVTAIRPHGWRDVFSSATHPASILAYPVASDDDVADSGSLHGGARNSSPVRDRAGGRGPSPDPNPARDPGRASRDRHPNRDPCGAVRKHRRRDRRQEGIPQAQSIDARPLVIGFLAKSEGNTGVNGFEKALVPAAIRPARLVREARSRASESRHPAAGARPARWRR